MAKRILVIDDNETILESIRFILEEERYEVYSWTSFIDFQELAKIDPDLIILDIFLSDGQDGREIAKKLKSNSVTKSIPLIIISAYSYVEESVAATGAEHFLPKPFDMYDLLQTVGTSLTKPDIN